jgi:hypothetical protein
VSCVSLIASLARRDNLEFLQWLRQFWDRNYSGEGYDPVARRKGVAAEPPATMAPLAAGRAGGLSAGGTRAGGKTPVGGYRSSSTQPNEATILLQAQVKELSGHLEGLEKERDFYFEKVRFCDNVSRPRSHLILCDGTAARHRNSCAATGRSIRSRRERRCDFEGDTEDPIFHRGTFCLPLIIPRLLTPQAGRL